MEGVARTPNGMWGPDRNGLRGLGPQRNARPRTAIAWTVPDRNGIECTAPDRNGMHGLGPQWNTLYQTALNQWCWTIRMDEVDCAISERR